MNLTMLPKCYKFIIGILTIICQVPHSIELKNYNDAASLANPTNYYDHALHILGRYKRQNTNTNQSCKIPNYLPNSIYEIITEPVVMYKPGDRVKNYSTLRITCEKGYKQPPFALHSSLCLNGQWENLPPACVRTCPSLKSTKTMIVKCKYNSSISLDNCIHPVEGTTVRLSCNEFYEADAAIKRNPIRVCKEGEWTPNLPECYATCGLKSPKATLNIINGGNVTRGDYPWHIGIYTNTEEFRCGGSVIHQNIILSAAHCFADYSGNKYPAKNYLVAAGKYFNKYHDDRDEYAQYSSVREIFVPEQYKSINGFNSFDIAVVIMEDPFTFTLGVQPVCIELNDEYENTNYLMNNNGIVTGWGYIDEGQVLSDGLKELIIPYIPYDQCYNQVPSNFKKFITSDKLCGGFINQSTSVCQGDSGGGLVYNLNNHYYIKGIVSTSPASTESGVVKCDSQQYGLYTSVQYHTDFITPLIANYGWKENVQCVREDCTNEHIENRESCPLPNFPQHGKYSLPNNNIQYKSGNYVLIHDAVLLSCDTGYVANPPGATQFYCLGKGQWIPAVGTCKECVQDSDCSPEKPACYNYTCKNPCEGVCGSNANCELKSNFTPVCSCPRNMTGDPLVSCRAFTKEDLCEPNPCGSNAKCEPGYDKANQQRPVCNCLPGYRGDPLTACYEDLCEPNPCGSNAKCKLGYNKANQQRPVCDCLPGYRGDPLTACIEDLCEPSPCGSNATCKFLYEGINKEKPVCYCPPGYHGNPFTTCIKEDLCEPNPCGFNAKCELGYDEKNEERPVCDCFSGYHGDPLAGCTEIEEVISSLDAWFAFRDIQVDSADDSVFDGVSHFERLPFILRLDSTRSIKKIASVTCADTPREQLKKADLDLLSSATVNIVRSGYPVHIIKANGTVPKEFYENIIHLACQTYMGPPVLLKQFGLNFF